MKLANLFEANNNLLQKFIITCWGKLLYLDYLDLPMGKDQSNNPELYRFASKYLACTDDEELEDLDEWIADGARLKNGTILLTKQTVDTLLHSCEKPLSQDLKVYRFQKGDSNWVKDSWISVTTFDSGYSGDRIVINLPKGTKVIDTMGLADTNEYIISTNLLK